MRRRRRRRMMGNFRSRLIMLGLIIMLWFFVGIFRLWILFLGIGIWPL